MIPLPIAIPETSPMVLLTLILKEYFTEFYCILQFADNFAIRNISQHGNFLITGRTKLAAEHVQKFDLCLGFVINLNFNQVETFEMIEQFIQKQSRVRFQERKYVVTFWTTSDTDENEFNLFFRSKYLNFVSDVLVVKLLKGEGDDNGNYGLFTHEYVGLNGSNVIKIDEFNGTTKRFVNDTILFPDKVMNLHGKRLIVGGEKYLPITDPVQMKGPETELLIEYAEKRNVTLVFDRTFNYLGVFYQNWTGTGYCKLLLEDKIDLIAYAVYIGESRTRFGDFARPLCEIRVTCLVPKPRLMSEWMVVDTFTYGVWLLIGSVLFVIMLIFKYLKLYFKWMSSSDINKLQYIIAIRILIAQPFDVFENVTLRFLYGILLLGFILIQTFFNSKLSSFIAVPIFIDDVNTLINLAESDFLWHSKFNDKGALIRNEKSEPLATLYKKFRLVENEISEIKEARYGYAVDESFASHFFTIDEYFTLEKLEEFKVMKEYIIGHQFTGYLVRRNSVWLNEIDKFCTNAMEHGLIKYWEKDSISDPKERKIQEYLGLSRVSSNTPKTIQLNLEFFVGYFIIWTTGLSLSTIIFILEYKRFKFIAGINNLVGGYRGYTFKQKTNNGECK